VEITLEEEREATGGWEFDATVRDDRGGIRRFILRLAWADYNHWSPDGSDPPELVAKAALRFMLSREPAAEIASKFDAARIRRRYPDSDDEIPTLIGR